MMQTLKSFLLVSSLFLAFSLQPAQVFAGSPANVQTQKAKPNVTGPNVTAPAQVQAPNTGTQSELNNRTTNDPNGGVRIRTRNQDYDPNNDSIVCNKNSSSPESTTDCNQ